MPTKLDNGKKVYYLVLTGQILLFFFLFICIALIPHFLFEKNEGGISNYGLYAKTIVPFTLSTLSAVVLTTIASYILPKKTRYYKKLTIGMRIWAVLAVASLITSYIYKLSNTNHNIHEWVAICLFLFEIAFSGWLIFTALKDKVNLAAWGLQILMFAIGILNLVGGVHLLFLIEVGGGLGYAVVLVRSIKSITSQL